MAYFYYPYVKIIKELINKEKSGEVVSYTKLCYNRLELIILRHI